MLTRKRQRTNSKLVNITGIFENSSYISGALYVYILREFLKSWNGVGFRDIVASFIGAFRRLCTLLTSAVALSALLFARRSGLREFCVASV